MNERPSVQAFETDARDATGPGMTPGTRRSRPAGLSPLPFIKRLFQTRLDKTPKRTKLVALFFTLLFGVIVIRLIMFGFKPDDQQAVRAAGSDSVAAARPDILDRNGEILATDIKVMSIFAEPRRLVDKDEAVELLTAALPSVNAAELRRKLGSTRASSG